jgi:hypothetical protein
LSIPTSTSILFVNRNIGINLAEFFKMSGIGGRNNGRCGRGRGGRGRGAHGGRGRERGQNYTGSANAAKRGICTNLGTNVFNYGHNSAAYQMRTSWEKLLQYVGTNYGQDINNELKNKITVVLVEPVHMDDVLMRHGVREVMIRTPAGTPNPIDHHPSLGASRNRYGRSDEACNSTERDCPGRIRRQH